MFKVGTLVTIRGQKAAGRIVSINDRRALVRVEKPVARIAVAAVSQLRLAR